MALVRPFARVQGLASVAADADTLPEIIAAVRDLARQMAEVQTNVGLVLDQLPKIDILDGRRVNDVALTAGSAVDVSHGLGRKYRGVIVVSQNAAGTVRESTNTNSFPDRIVIMTASATITADLWVF